MVPLTPRSPLRRSRGQIAVMSLFYMILLVYMAGMFVNVSQAVTRKVHAQMIADAAAYTGAVYQARGLNAVTKTNRIIGDIWNIYWSLETILSGPTATPDSYIPWPVQGPPQAIKGIFEPVLQLFRMIVEFQNFGYAGLAYSKAKDNAENNLRYFFRADPDNTSIKMYGGNIWVDDTIGLFKHTVDPLMGMIPALGIPTPALTKDSMFMPWGVQVRGDFDVYYLNWFFLGVTYTSINCRGDLWLKPSGEELRFYWVVSLPETDAMFMPQLMKIPPVAAVGTAKAYGGNRGPEEANDMLHDGPGAYFGFGMTFVDLVQAFLSVNEPGSGDGFDQFKPTYKARLCPTPADFIFHFWAFGGNDSSTGFAAFPNGINFLDPAGSAQEFTLENYYSSYTFMQALWAGGVLH